VTNQVGVSWIGETHGLAAVDSLSEGAMEEGILHIEQLNRHSIKDPNHIYAPQSKQTNLTNDFFKLQFD
jgi:hypothetical protein